MKTSAAVSHEFETSVHGHTPGPWSYKNEGGHIVARNSDGILKRKESVARVYPQPLDEDKANARLIAAAPDMLSTLVCLERGLRDLEEACRSIVGDTGTANMAREKADWCATAIAKATGASQL